MSDDLRGQLEAAFASQQEAEPEVAPEKAETPETAAPEVEAVEQKAERARDEKGRFAPKEAAPPEEPAPRGAAKAEPAEPGVAKQQDDGFIRYSGNDKLEVKPQDDRPPAPPNGWSAEAKAKWHELPPEIMSAVQKREQDVAKFTSTRDEHASFGKEIYQTVQPYLATIRAEGGTPKGAIESLLNTAYVLRTGAPEHKKQLLLQTARQFGIDLGTPAEPTNTPPELQALQQEVAELKGLLRQRDEAVHNQLQTEVQSEIEAFAADPKHTHYQEVKAHMAALLREGVAKDLQDAYDQATWARPDLRATLLAQQRAEEEQKRRDEAKAKAEAAKRKSISITGGPGNTAAQSAPGGRSIRDELEAAMAASSGAV